MDTLLDLWPWLVLLLLVLAVLGGWMLTALGLWGNWVCLGAVLLYTLAIPESFPAQIKWSSIGVILLLALIGEGLESLTGAYTSKKAGGSRRGMVLAIIGSLIGALLGFPLGSALFPVIGSAIAALFFGGLGALAGALLGELWKGRSVKHGIKVGHAAFWGRVLGTVGKSTCATLIAAIIFLGLLVN